jgi:hypothetical protein
MAAAMPQPPPTSSVHESIRPLLADIRRFPIFVSYGDEAKPLKTKVKRLVEEALNRQLVHGNWRAELVVWDWRDMAAQRAPDGGRTNDIFVEKAKESSVTIVLLFDHMPPGSEEELLAVLKEKDIDLKVFWLNRTPEEGASEESEVAQFLDSHGDDFKYIEFSELESEDTWVELTSNLVAVLLQALRGQDRPPYMETRGAA